MKVKVFVRGVAWLKVVVTSVFRLAGPVDM